MSRPDSHYLSGGLTSVFMLHQKRTILPDSAFASFQQSGTPPEVSEGFKEVKQVTFKFEGSEEERKAWCQWLY